MNQAELQRLKDQIEHRRSKVDLVLQEYSARAGCPCGFTQFVYWAGKKQGPGWQDNLQNQLVSSSVKLECFTRVEDFKKAYWLEGEYRCTTCGARWHHFSEEWRMLAFQERLLIIGGPDPSTLYDGVISSEIAATVGREPAGVASLSLDEWVAFMLGRSG